MKNKFFNKVVGIVLSSSIIVTGIISSPPAFAEESNSTQSKEQNSVTEEANYANFENVSIVEEYVDKVSIKVVLDKNIEDTDMPLYFYEENNPESLKEFSTGGKEIKFDVDRSDSTKRYYFTTGSHTSDFITVEPILDNSWGLSISTDKTIMSTVGGNPKITWNANKTNGADEFYFIDENDKIVKSFGFSDKTRTFELPGFYNEKQKSYRGYLSDYVSNAEKLDDLKNIVAKSNEITIDRAPWNISASIDKNSYDTDNEVIKLTWETNEYMYDGNYRVFLVNKTKNKVLEKIYSTSLRNNSITMNYVATGGEHLKLPFDGSETELVLYVAKNNNAQTIEELEDIQAISNVLNTKHIDWQLSANIDSTYFYTYDETPIVSWNLNQTVGRGYALYFVDEETGEILDDERIYDKGEFTIKRFYTEKSKNFKIYLSERDDYAENVSELGKTLLTSQNFKVVRAAWTIKSQLNKGDLLVETNQPVFSTGGKYKIYVVNAITHNIEYDTDMSYQQTLEKIDLWWLEYYDGVNGKYFAVVAKDEYFGDNGKYEDLKDIQAESDVAEIYNKKWYIGLLYTSSSISSTERKLSFDVRYNNSLRNENKQVFVVENKSGKVVKTHYPTNASVRSFKFDYVVNKNSEDLFTAYVADYNSTTAKTVNDLTNIVASSETRYPNNEVYDGPVGEAPPFYRGGYNPSKSDCFQSCYGDPINSFTGEYFETTNDLESNSVFDLKVSRSFSTFNKDTNGVFGKGSNFNYGMKLYGEYNDEPLSNSEYIFFQQENASIVEFRKIIDPITGENKYITNNDNLLKIEETSTGYSITRKNGYEFLFNNSGKLTKVKDLHGNYVELVYNNNVVTDLTTNDGKTIHITWNNNKISQVEDLETSTKVQYIYNSKNELVEVKNDNFENSKKYEYDNSGRVSKIIQYDGKIYTNAYNAKNKVTKQTDPSGQITKFAYTENYDTFSTKTTLPNGVVNYEVYDEYGKTIEKTLAYNKPEAATYAYSYNMAGQINKETNPDLNDKQYRYDIDGNLIAIVDELERTYRFTYNDKGQVVETILPNGAKSTNVYDEKYHLIKTVDFNNNSTKFEVDSFGRKISETSANNIESNDKTKFSYDSKGNLTKITSPNSGENKLTYNSKNLITKSEDAVGNITNYKYDNYGNIVETEYPNSSTEKIVYDDFGRVVEEIDKLNNSTTYTYNSMGNILSETNAYGTASFEYNNHQKLIKQIFKDGNEENYTYDNLGRLIKTTYSNGAEYTNTYNDLSLLESTTDALGNVTEYYYDKVGNIRNIYDAYDNRTANTYDSLNRLISTKSPNSYEEKYEYDNNSNKTKTIAPNMEITYYKYDSNNNLIETKYPNDKINKNYYDNNDNIIKTIDKTGAENNYTYYLNNMLKTQKDNSNNTKSFKYDSMDNLSETSFDNFATVDSKFEYNLNNQIISEIDSDNDRINYAYDQLGNLTKRGPPNSTNENSFNNPVEYSYDDLGRIKEQNYSSGLEVKYSYDTFGNLHKVSQNNTDLAIFEYDLNNNNTSTIYSNGIVKNNTFDKLSRLTNIKLNQNEEIKFNKNISYTYDGLISHYDSSLDSENLNNNDVKYNSNQRLSNVINKTTSKNNSHKIDNNNNLISNNSVTNEFNKDSERLEKSIFGNDEFVYEYDNNGNRTRKEDVSNENNSWDYQWDKNNKLVSAKDNSNNKTIDYSYDSNGLLKNKTKENNIENFVWDFNSDIPVILEDNDYNYIYGLDNSPFAQISKTDNEITFLHGDEKNSVILTSDNNGVLSKDKSYDEYGNSDYTNSVTSFGFAGEYLDEDTGLYNLRARWFEPLTGSFVSKDPAISLTGESYSYASGNPLLFTDPLGLWSETAGNDLIIGAIDGLTWIPIASTIMNQIQPDSVNICSEIFIGASMTTGIVGFGKIGLSAKAAKGLTTKQARKSILDAAKNAPQNGSSFIYLRTNPLTEKIYVGKSKSAASYKRRQDAHNRKLQKQTGDKTLRYKFKDLAYPEGYKETKRTEEYLIRAGGGPKNKSNPYGVLENKIYASIDKIYQALGGDF